MTPPNAEIVLQAEQIAKTYGRNESAIHAVNRVDLQIARGEMLAVVGPSGSGKTTLLHLLAGLERPDHGEIRVLDREFHAVSDSEVTRLRLKHLGFVFQANNLMPTMTALDNVALPLLLLGSKRRTAYAKARQHLEQVGLADRTTHRSSQLSGGEQQRVSFARALVNDPAIVFADEPTGSLDRNNSELVTTLLRETVSTADRAVMIVTHDPLVAACSDRVAILSDGQIADEFQVSEVGSVDAISHRMLRSG
ncbi:MAG: ABC transporter ATP-binding protein [Planctomycetota bacterium]